MSRRPKSNCCGVWYFLAYMAIGLWFHGFWSAVCYKPNEPATGTIQVLLVSALWPVVALGVTLVMIKKPQDLACNK